MKIHNVEQRTAAWFDLRCGKPTASSFDKIITPEGTPRNGELREKYLYKLAAEAVLKRPADDEAIEYFKGEGTHSASLAAERGLM